MVTVAVRGARLVVEAAVRVTLPLPAPLPAFNVSQASSLVAVHGASSRVAAILTVVVSPGATAFQLPALRVNVLEAAACVTTTVWPATVTVAVRTAPLLELPAIKARVALPVPLLAPSVSHAAEDVATQGASWRELVMTTFSLAPAEPTSQVERLRVKVLLLDPF